MRTTTNHAPGWGMRRDDACFLLTAPGAPSDTQRTVLADVLGALLDGKQTALMIESNNPALLRALPLGKDARILRSGARSALITCLDQPLPGTLLSTLPRTGEMRLRIAGFTDQAPHELACASLLDDACPAALTLDCTSDADCPALSIRFDPSRIDEQALVSAVRDAVQRSGEQLHFAN